MPVNKSDIFKCDIHDFSTNDIKEWDQHCLEYSHEYDLHTKCACGCGQDIHVLSDTKLDPSARRIPRGHMADVCKAKIKDAKKIKESGEIERAKKE